MKRLLPLLLVLLLLTACTPKAPAPATEPAPTEPARTPYAGSLRDYTYYYEEGRDREWEEDILYVAGVFTGELFGYEHPYLTDGKISTMNTMDGLPVEFRSHFDAQKKETFLRDINELIPRISLLHDYEILFALQLAVAKLGDLHSRIYFPYELQYPIYFAPFYTGETVGYHAIVLPEEHEDLLCAQLVAVNEIPIDQVIARMEPYMSYENQYALNQNICDYICCNELLAVCGIAAHKEKGTRFTLEARDGTRTTLELDPLNDRDFAFTEFAGLEEYWSFPYRINTESLYWWDYLEEEDILYVRMNQIVEDYYNYNYSTFTQSMLDHVKAGPAGQTVVMDFRDNPGGTYDANLAIKLTSVLKHKNVERAYVLIDGGSYSGAIVTSASICLLTDKAVLVGSPGGQPTNFYACNFTYTMPNSGRQFTMSDLWMLTDPTDTDPALMPDVVIHQTLEDYLAGRDTVMEAIIAGEVR